MAAIAKLGEQATQAGVLLDTAGLAPSAAGARIELSGGSISVSDGPFTEAKDLVSYAIYQVATKEEAVEWASRFVHAHVEHGPATSATCRCSRCSDRRISGRPPETLGCGLPGDHHRSLGRPRSFPEAHDKAQRSDPQRARVPASGPPWAVEPPSRPCGGSRPPV